MADGVRLVCWPTPERLTIGIQVGKPAESEGTTILIAIHDLAVGVFVDQVRHLRDGRIVNS